MRLDALCLLHSAIYTRRRETVMRFSEKSGEIRLRDSWVQGKELNTGFGTEVQ